MINQKLLNPSHIAIIGGSDDHSKPGGKVLRNIIEGGFSGELRVVNPKCDLVQGIKSYRDVRELPATDLAIIAVAAPWCRDIVSILAEEKGTGGFIILSAGFSEEDEAGAELEREIVRIVESAGATLIGPNCIGFLNHNYNGIFTSPVPQLNSAGVDFISGSGATAVFIMESAIPDGILFSSIWSVGNSAQTGVEEVLRHLDETYIEGESAPVKILYIESISKPEMLLKHASSLVEKGCRIAAVKAGSSEAGSRAASSHTGALSNPDVAVDALFRKAGIIRCYSRQELVAVTGVMLHPPLAGKRIAIVTHAGGPAVMMTDALSSGGLTVPPLSGKKAEDLLAKLFPGSSVANPIDFLATGTAEQLGQILDACENDFDDIDGVVVIFGTPGLFPVDDVYTLLDQRMKSMKKPIFPVLPSLITAQREVRDFIGRGRINFPDEVVLARAMCMAAGIPHFQEKAISAGYTIDSEAVRRVVERAGNGYLGIEDTGALLDAAGIGRPYERVITREEEVEDVAVKTGYPLVMKVTGPVHKSDVGGVILNINTDEAALSSFKRLMEIEGASGVLVQPMLKGTELFAGVKREGNFGHLVMCGLGGIFIEVLRDIATGIAPVGADEADYMIRSLKGYRILEGVRGQEGVDLQAFRGIVVRLSLLADAAPEIFEMDINPLLGTPDSIVAVDARIRIERD
ncbi:MAG: acetate--CoA ligase family protein [Bacteroidales bacterium]|nr:acetate--CoA ligase family protein [Bacteroidales bacterium]